MTTTNCDERKMNIYNNVNVNISEMQLDVDLHSRCAARSLFRGPKRRSRQGVDAERCSIPRNFRIFLVEMLHFNALLYAAEQSCKSITALCADVTVREIFFQL